MGTFIVHGAAVWTLYASIFEEMINMAVTDGCGVFKGGIQNYKGFWLKINTPKDFFVF